MHIKQVDGINESLLIIGTHNFDIHVFKSQLAYLVHQSKNKNHTVILSHIPSSAEDEATLYLKVAELLKSSGVKRFIGIGSKLKNQADSFTGLTTKFYESTGEFLKNVNKSDFLKETILLTGAVPSCQTEEIVGFLQEDSRETVLEVDLTKMVENLNFIRSKLSPDTKVMAMVKAFAYGAGSYDVAQILAYNQIDYLSVAYADEGISLRKDGITTPIMVLNPELPSYDAMIRYNLEPQIFSFRTLRYFTEALKANSQTRSYAVHIKINTGMNRLGFDEKDLPKLAEELDKNDVLEVKSVFSHLACSDDSDRDAFTKKQIADFTNCADFLEGKLSNRFMRHILNSNGILRYPEAQMDMVRLGLALYGITSSAEFRDRLMPVSSLKTVISQIRTLQTGEGVGYTPKKLIQQKTKIAVIPVGYADGLPRLLGNGGGSVLISNKAVPFIGNICMDMCMVDVTGIDCEEGDDVEVFGENLDIYEMAEHLQTIPYEVLTNISRRVKRVFIQK